MPCFHRFSWIELVCDNVMKGFCCGSKPISRIGMERWNNIVVVVVVVAAVCHMSQLLDGWHYFCDWIQTVRCCLLAAFALWRLETTSWQWSWMNRQNKSQWTVTVIMCNNAWSCGVCVPNEENELSGSDDDNHSWYDVKLWNSRFYTLANELQNIWI